MAGARNCTLFRVPYILAGPCISLVDLVLLLTVCFVWACGSALLSRWNLFV